MRGFCASHGRGIDLKNLILPPTAKSNKTEAYTNTHSTTTTTTNSWRRRQTRRELISSPTRRVLQRERDREMEKDVEGLFLLMYGSQACRPLIPLTLTPSSVTPKGMFLFISLSYPSSISICHPPPCRARPFLYTRLPCPYRCLHLLQCFRCVTSPQTVEEQPVMRHYVSKPRKIKPVDQCLLYYNSHNDYNELHY